MANSTVVSNVIKILGGFTIGAAVTTGLHSFTGTSFLFNTQTEVNDYVTNVQDSMGELSTFLDGNNVVNDEVIQKYKNALGKANDNINQLISYIDNMTLNESELQNKVNQYESDIADLKTTIDGLQKNVDAQVQSQVNEVITKANAEIDKANTASEETYNNVNKALTGSKVNEMVQNIKDKNSALTVTDKELQVRDISDIVGGSSQTPTTPQEPSQTPQPDTSETETDKSEETPSLYITDVTTNNESVYDIEGNGRNATVFHYKFSDGKEFFVTKSNSKVDTLRMDNHRYAYMDITNSEVQESEFVTGGYMDLINNY